MENIITLLPQILGPKHSHRDSRTKDTFLTNIAMSDDFENLPAPNVSFFTPGQFPPSGTAVVPQPDGKAIPTLFQPLKIRGLEMQNRIVVSSPPILVCGVSHRSSVATALSVMPIFYKGRWLHRLAPRSP